MRVKCPNCGSTAQVRIIETEYEEDGELIKAFRTYKCGCGRLFLTCAHYKWDGEEFFVDKDI